MEFGIIKQKYSARQLSPAHRYLAMLMGRDLFRQLRTLKAATAVRGAYQTRTYIRSMCSSKVVGV